MSAVLSAPPTMLPLPNLATEVTKSPPGLPNEDCKEMITLGQKVAYAGWIFEAIINSGSTATAVQRWLSRYYATKCSSWWCVMSHRSGTKCDLKGNVSCHHSKMRSGHWVPEQEMRGNKRNLFKLHQKWRPALNFSNFHYLLLLEQGAS